VAREYDIPAVLSIGIANKCIHDGYTIIVDGNIGMTILGKNGGAGRYTNKILNREVNTCSVRIDAGFVISILFAPWSGDPYNPQSSE
jgi:hypothetical protein